MSIHNLNELGAKVSVLARNNYSSACKVCKGSGWELYYKTEWGIEYEYARRCPKCNGVTTQLVQQRRDGSGVPSKYQNNVTMDDFNPDIYAQISGKENRIADVMKIVNSFVSSFYEWERQGMGLYIYSETKGSGKSFLASCIVNTVMNKYALPSKYVPASELLERSKYDTGIRDLQDIKLLVVDDLGVKKTGLNWMDDVLFQLVDSRNSNGKVTIYTSNIKWDALQIDERVSDRINEKTIFLQLPEVTVRSSQGNKDKLAFCKSLNLGGKDGQ